MPHTKIIQNLSLLTELYKIMISFFLSKKKKYPLHKIILFFSSQVVYLTLMVPCNCFFETERVVIL